MRYLGIDYGAQRVGLALSDESGKIAFPESILNNRKDLVEKIANLCGQKKVGKIVLGESLNYQRQDNQIMKEIREFKKDLETKTNLEIILEPEWLTSMLAKRALDGQANSGKKMARMDDSAAALILQTYLDRL
ncbi:MAG: Holliday junction resolvase RuvX [Patescibacteria group bacterium]